jgi:hypothetical protein
MGPVEVKRMMDIVYPLIIGNNRTLKTRGGRYLKSHPI